VSNFTQYVKSLVLFGEERQQEIRWLFDALDTSLAIAQKNATVQRSSSAASSLRHAKNLLSFLNRCFADLPDKQLVAHLEDFFAMLDRAVDQSIQLPLEEDLEEIRELIAELQKGWETLLMPSTTVTKEDDRSHMMSIA
jgi:flagellin-specific chaperone FliS